MPRRPSATRRWLTALTWPVGIAITSWDYMWRTTPLHRREVPETDSVPHLPPELSPAVDRTEIQTIQSGYGPLFHRRYTTFIRESPVDAEALMARLKRDVNGAAPTAFARFQRVLGEGGALGVGDEYVVRMPGPWDGPVRVVEETACSFRLATLAGHLEAGQIEFRTRPAEAGRVRVEIESWARSGGRFSDLLYQHAHMSKEVQLHMWVSFLEGVVGLSGGRMVGGVDIDTRRVELGVKPPAKLAPRLAALSHTPVNYDPERLDLAHPPAGWAVDDRRTALPAEAPGAPEPGGSFEIARRLIRGYAFADPSLVRAYYDPDAPLEGRDMLLELRALGLVKVHVGVRVCVVWDDTHEDPARGRAQVWGWAYRTLEGHVEAGQMGWQVWKWLADGTVEFRTHAVSRTAPIANPVIWVGFHALKRYERRLYLDSTARRMRELTAAALADDAPADAVRAASPGLTARGGAGREDPAHEELAERLEAPE